MRYIFVFLVFLENWFVKFILVLVVFNFLIDIVKYDMKLCELVNM